jgi:hypothetical protein
VSLVPTYDGVRSGRSHSLPVQCTRDGDCLTALVGDSAHKRWWRNLRQPVPVRLRLEGAHVAAVGALVVHADRRAQLVTGNLQRYPRAAGVVDGAQALLLQLTSAGGSNGPTREPSTAAE